MQNKLLLISKRLISYKLQNIKKKKNKFPITVVLKLLQYVKKTLKHWTLLIIFSDLFLFLQCYSKTSVTLKICMLHV